MESAQGCVLNNTILRGDVEDMNEKVTLVNDFKVKGGYIRPGQATLVNPDQCRCRHHGKRRLSREEMASAAQSGDLYRINK